MSEYFNNWGDIAEALVKAQSQVIKKAAFDCQAQIQAEISSQHLVDTGFMKNAVYVVTSEESTYGQGATPPPGAMLLPEIAKPDSDKEAYVAGGASYTWWLNYGTHAIPTHGFFEKGMERVRPGFDKAMELIHQKMAEAGR